MTFEDYKSLVKGLTTEKRFRHSVNVSAAAAKLAEHYGADPEKAALAGILHDCCKNMTKEEQLHWISKSGIILDDITLTQPQLWHAVAGAAYLSC